MFTGGAGGRQGRSLRGSGVAGRRGTDPGGGAHPGKEEGLLVP